MRVFNDEGEAGRGRDVDDLIFGDTKPTPSER